MNPWVMLGIGLLLGFSMGSWLSRRKAIAQAVASVRAELEAVADARAMATGGSVVMFNGLPHVLHDSTDDRSAIYDRSAIDYDHNGASLDPRTASGNGLGRLGPVGVVPDDGRGVVDSWPTVDIWRKPLEADRRA